MRGWVDNAEDHIAAADRIVSSCGNTTFHQVMQTGKPWIAIPNGAIAEQERKAEALAAAGLCASQPTWPSDAAGWARLWQQARQVRPGKGRELIDADAAVHTARRITCSPASCGGALPPSHRPRPGCRHRVAEKDMPA